MPNRATKRPQTERDLRSIWQYVAEQGSVGSADALLRRIEQAFDQLAGHPRSGRVRPELADDLRSFPIDRYLIFYVVMDYGVEVVRVMHAARNIGGMDMQSPRLGDGD